MKHTMKVYKNSAEHRAYLKARFDKSNAGQSFEWAGHRWTYDMTSFDDSGDYDLLYRFDDQPYPESNANEDLSIRDQLAAMAMNGYLANAWQAEELESLGESSAIQMATVAEISYLMADAMLRAREAS